MAESLHLAAARRVRGNDWPSLRPARLGDWRPTLRVSVVVPAHRAEATLPYTLASLAAQTYPAELLEVVVVDDGTEPSLELPRIRPDRTRVVATKESWGRAHACHVGALAADGDVLHWLDADMLLYHDEVEAQLRWHHLLDYAVVLGHKTFVDVAPGMPDVESVLRTVQDGRAADLFPDRWTSPHDWVEEHIQRYDGLTANAAKSYLVHVGASASVGRALYLEAGGMDESLKLGEDVELGYRLSQQGAVFVPDVEARSWHLGRSTLMQQQESVNRYNRPFVTDRIADMRHWRARGRSYSVPWVEVVVDATDRSFEEVRHSVNGCLAGTAADVTVLVTAPWGRLDDERRSPLLDPDRDLRMLRAELAGDARVRMVEEVAATAFPATYRLRLPAGWTPGRDSLRRLAYEMARRDRGLVSLLMPDGQVARLERTSAFHRAMRLTDAGEDLDAVVDEVSKTWWYEAVEEGFSSHLDAASPESAASPAPAGTASPSAPGARATGTPRGGAARREGLPRPDAVSAERPYGAAKQPRGSLPRRVGRLLRTTLRRVRRG